VIADVLPAGVAAEEAYDDPPDVVLFAAEAAVIARAVDKRRREFTTARWCARAALARIGVEPGPLVPDQRGAPSWPAGVVGSMTHCAGYRAAAVASAQQFATLGIDAEPNEPLPDGVLSAVSVPQERPHLAALAADHPDVQWERLLFCAKEAVYKAWYPLTRRWLGFEEAVITFDPAGATFEARLLTAPPDPTGFSGRWLARDQLLIAAIAQRA
jgi:4'-phosphopantetheinyl transferase EntD